MYLPPIERHAPFKTQVILHENTSNSAQKHTYQDMAASFHGACMYRYQPPDQHLVFPMLSKGNGFGFSSYSEDGDSTGVDALSRVCENTNGSH